MLYCKHCGSELKGAKNFCMVCGKKQDKLKPEESGTVVKSQKTKGIGKKIADENGKCVRCGEETEKKCFFCEVFVCRDHYSRMQANIYPYEELTGLKALGEKAKINQGWRGYIINACPKCSSIKNTKGLTVGESDAINLVEHCSWYRLDR